MSAKPSPSIALLAAACLALAGSPRTRAAETFHTCTGFIDALPAVVSTQGTWCLRRDLSTANTSGAAIAVGANNVTIDCNGFKLGGLAAGNAVVTRAVFAQNRLNTTVRRCNIRGFREGVYLLGGGGHLIEDNRFEQNLVYGILVLSETGSLIRRNLVHDTGGHATTASSVGIAANADVLDNTVTGVFATIGNATVTGIHVSGDDNHVRGNRVRGLMPAGTALATGIYAGGSGSVIEDNRLAAGSGDATAHGYAISGYGPHTFCLGNTAIRFDYGIAGCEYGAGNLP